MIKRVLLISVLVFQFIFISSLMAQDESDIKNDFDYSNVITNNIATSRYTPQIVYDSDYIPIAGQNGKMSFLHNLQSLPIKVDLLMRDSAGRLTGWNTGFYDVKGGWYGNIWDLKLSRDRQI